MVKSPDEIARIRRSVETNSRAFEQGVARVQARHEGAGPGRRAGIPHAPAGRREAFVRNHRGGRRAVGAAARAAHRRALRKRAAGGGGYGRGAGRLLQRYDAHAVPGYARPRR